MAFSTQGTWEVHTGPHRLGMWVKGVPNLAFRPLLPAQELEDLRALHGDLDVTLHHIVCVFPRELLGSRDEGFQGCKKVMLSCSG